MFFSQALDTEKQEEWNKLIHATEFNLLWNKFEENKTATNFISCIMLLIDTIKADNKPISEVLCRAITQQLESVLRTLNTDDMHVLALKYIKKLTYESDIIRHQQQKRLITYQIGEANTKNTDNCFTNKAIVSANNYNPAVVEFFDKNNTVIRYSYLGTMLSGGLFLLNTIGEPSKNKLLVLGLQLAYIAFIGKSSDLLIPKDIALLTNKEKCQVLEKQINILRQNLAIIDQSISQLNQLTSDEKRQVHKLN